MIDAVGNVQRVLLLGGTSEIGLAVLRELAGDRPVRAVQINDTYRSFEAQVATKAARGF